MWGKEERGKALKEPSYANLFRSKVAILSTLSWESDPLALMGPTSEWKCIGLACLSHCLHGLTRMSV